MVPKNIRFAYRMTHISNIPAILKCGIVHVSSPNSDPSYVPIGDVTAIKTRETKYLVDGSCLGDYIPFYLGPRTPMLYVIQNGFNGVTKQSPSDIVYCVISLDELVRDNVECVFTDGHALNRITKVFEGSKIPEINEILKVEDLYQDFWNSDAEDKRKKEAELLLKNDLPPSYIRYFVVYCVEAKNELMKMGVDESKIRVTPSLYY